jgi:nicotinate phosphoribosyltransferase
VPARDVIALVDEPAPAGGEPLLAPVMRGGARIGPPEGLDAVRARARRELAALPAALRGLDEEEERPWAHAASDAFAPEISPRLAELIEVVRARVTAAPAAEPGRRS